MTGAFPDETMVLATHGKRLAAAALDAVFSTFVLGVFGALGFAVGLAGASTNSDADSDGWEDLGWILLGSFVGLLVGAVVWLALTVWLVRRHGACNGQTLGKQLLGIRAARVSRQEIGVGTALVREILAKGMLVALTASIVSTALGFLDAGLLGVLVAIAVWYGPALADDQRRALHDRLCRTRVVDAAYAAYSPRTTDDDLWPAAPVA